MSNPITGYWSLNSSLAGVPGVFTGVAPIRHDGGLRLEQSTTNLIANPVAWVSTAGWAGGVNRTLTRTTSLPAPLPDGPDGITTGLVVTATADLSGAMNAVVYVIS